VWVGRESKRGQDGPSNLDHCDRVIEKFGGHGKVVDLSSTEMKRPTDDREAGSSCRRFKR
jgi:hypothetical protein